MGRMQKKKMAQLRAGEDTPLGVAIEARDGDTMNMVKDAILHKQVILAFQPVVTAAAPNAPVFYESLIRVLDDTGRVIPARDFMNAVEAHELGRKLDCLALEKSIAALTRTPALKLSINMSARSIGYKEWLRILNRALSRRPDIAERLVLEISEKSAMHLPELVIDFMDELQMRKIAFALDDFGAGMTSFNYFKDFYFDILKLDGGFTRNIHEDEENQAIAGGIAAIARNLDIVTVATRVEHPNDAQTLTALGFNCLQGYLFGAPTINPAWEASKNDRKAG